MARPGGSHDSDRVFVDLSDDHLDEQDSPLAVRQRCKDLVLTVFPDICNDYLEQIASEHSDDSNAIVEMILSRQESGESYPVQPRDNPLKRKRVDDDDDENDEIDDAVDDNINVDGHEKPVAGPAEKFATETRAKFHEPNRKVARDSSKAYSSMAVNLIATDFPNAPIKIIRNFLKANDGLLFNAYTAMDDLARNRNHVAPGWVDKKHSSKRLREFLPDQIHNVDLSRHPPGEQEAIVELRAARELSSIKDEEAAAKVREKEEFARAKSAGETAECGCCFEEYITTQMVQCDGETLHLFCRGCMRSQAETNIGYSKYELNCMSMDGCEGSFSRAQRSLFLDKKLRTAIERIEQEAALRMAGIENLETCPFCPYAAEYPPALVDKEFRCIKPGCRKISCRLCRKESHIPKSCAEAALDDGISARHELEEAMTAALVRNCNNCKNPFLKSDGCNKIQCTKCGAIQCYVCRQTIKSYDHFNDVARGGKRGQCPLFDNTEARHQEEVQHAEEEARRKVAEANPTIAADMLNMKVSEDVQQDELRRSRDNHARHHAGGMIGMIGAQPDILLRRAELRRAGLRHPVVPVVPVVPAAPLAPMIPMVPMYHPYRPVPVPVLRPQAQPAQGPPLHPQGRFGPAQLRPASAGTRGAATHNGLPKPNPNPHGYGGHPHFLLD